MAAFGGRSRAGGTNHARSAVVADAAVAAEIGKPQTPGLSPNTAPQTHPMPTHMSGHVDFAGQRPVGYVATTG